jgi:uncharacterized protein with FMN-binding domain
MSMKVHVGPSIAPLVLLLAATLLILSSCKVDKAAFARQVALQDVSLAAVPDGAYEASYDIQPPAGVMAANKHVRVRVTVAAGRYERIELLEPPGLASGKAFGSLADRLIQSQKLSVDAISSATVTSMAVLKAVQEAVQAAGR